MGCRNEFRPGDGYEKFRRKRRIPVPLPDTGGLSSRRRDVLVQLEYVFRIIFGLDFDKSIVNVAVGRLDAIRLVRGQKVDVGAALRVGLGGIEKLASPLHATLVVARVRPARMDIQDELGIPVWIRRGLPVDAIGRAAKVRPEYFALRADPSRT